MFTRRSFIHSASVILGGAITGFSFRPLLQPGKIMTVKGPIDLNNLGITLVHEHILVDFIGASQYDPTKWNHEEVIKKVLPYLKELKDSGCQSLVDCTPNYLGRDVVLLKKLSDLSGLHIVTNTGYYGGSDNKFLPAHTFDETAVQLADRWTKEWENGIDGTGIKPGFMKLSVNPDHLSPISQKLIEAAAKTHLRTGLTIASHTGPAVAAFEEVDILKREGVKPDAFIWVHAQNEKDKTTYIKAARSGMWVSLDGLHDDNVKSYTEMLVTLKKEKCLHRILVSHDAGWYEPDKPDGGTFRGFTTLFKKLLPDLEKNGFTRDDVKQVLSRNPGEVFTIGVRKI